MTDTRENNFNESAKIYWVNNPLSMHEREGEGFTLGWGFNALQIFLLKRSSVLCLILSHSVRYNKLAQEWTTKYAML